MATMPRKKRSEFQITAKTVRSATDLLTEALFLIDRSHRIILANNAAQTITGLPESLLLRKPIATVISLQLPQQGTKTNHIKLPTADLITLPARVHALNYSATFVPLAGLAHFSEFKPRPSALVIARPAPSHQLHDHTNTTLYVQTIGYLTMKIAHDLSNSLTSIIGNAELLHEQLNDIHSLPTAETLASLKDNELHDVIRKSREMAQFINTLREYARHPPINTHTSAVNDAIRETLSIARTLLGRKIQIDFIASDELPRIQMDRFRIDQLLFSILLSCTKAMPSGGLITLETKRATLDRPFTDTHRGARPGTYIQLTITDSSVGFDPEQLTRIFDLPSAEDFDFEGLGLPVLYSIVKRFDGYVTVDSSPENGKRFDIYIPHDPVPSTDPDQRALAPLPHSSESHGAANASLILVADDDSDVRRTIARYVSRAGYKTAFAADGKIALDLYKRFAADGNQPALLIADLGLPEIDGRTLSITIQQLFRSARILLISGYTPDITPMTGKTPEGFTFLQKPFEPNALLITIERLLNEEDPKRIS